MENSSKRFQYHCEKYLFTHDCIQTHRVTEDIRFDIVLLGWLRALSSLLDHSLSLSSSLSLYPNGTATLWSLGHLMLLLWWAVDRIKRSLLLREKSSLSRSTLSLFTLHSYPSRTCFLSSLLLLWLRSFGKITQFEWIKIATFIRALQSSFINVPQRLDECFMLMIVGLKSLWWDDNESFWTFVSRTSHRIIRWVESNSSFFFSSSILFLDKSVWKKCEQSGK